MKFAIMNDETSIFIVAATTLQEFEEFKGGFAEDGATGEITDVIEMLTHTLLTTFKIAPYSIKVDDISVLSNIAITNDIQIVDISIAKRAYETMMDHAELEARYAAPPDRRTLAEVCNLVDDDPWSKQTADESAASKKQAEAMQKIRDSGGLTGDSFGGSTNDVINVGESTVTLDENNNIIGVRVQATKATMAAYELIVEGDFNLTDLFDQMRIPENRIEEQEDGRAIVRFHDFQIKNVSRILDGLGMTYTLNIVLEETEKLFADFTNGDSSQQIYYSAVHPINSAEEVLPDVLTKSIIATHDLNGEKWIVCLRKLEADAIVAMVGGTVIATNNNGRPLLTAGADSIATIVDIHDEVMEDLPRAWNDRSEEMLTMTEEELEANLKTIKAGEFIFAAETHKYRTIVYIVPEAHFRATKQLWVGDLPIDYILPKGFLTPLGDGMFSTHYSLDLAVSNLIKQGFSESILLHLRLNEIHSEEIADRAR